MAENAVANGVEFLTNWEIKNLIFNKTEYRAESCKGVIKAKFVVNAAGLFCDKISSFLGITDFKVHPRRGQFHVLDRSAPIGTKPYYIARANKNYQRQDMYANDTRELAYRADRRGTRR